MKTHATKFWRPNPEPTHIFADHADELPLKKKAVVLPKYNYPILNQQDTRILIHCEEFTWTDNHKIWVEVSTGHIL